MENTPLTEKDFEKAKTISDEIKDIEYAYRNTDNTWCPKIKVQSAKRLLKQKGFCNLCEMWADGHCQEKHPTAISIPYSAIDACFQIPDGDDKDAKKT